jgi:NifU-like protein
MWNYSEKVKDHFFNPRNAKVVDDANAVGDVGSLSCGDALRLMLKVDPETEVILDAGFQTFGCGSAIASSSALTELVIGKTLDEAKTLSNQDIATYLDGLPPEKMHCSVMGEEALHAAIAQYRGEVIDDDHEDEGALICRCFGVDEGKIRRAVVTNKLSTLEDVINYTKAGGACACCHEKIEDLIKVIQAEPICPSAQVAAVAAVPVTEISLGDIPVTTPTQAAPAPAKVAPVALDDDAQQTLAQVRDVIDAARPMLQADGGDIALVGIKGNEVAVELSGACSGCMMAEMTTSWIEQRLMENIGRYFKLVSVATEPKSIAS